jgi:pSer/pThr/pTyr-binding forkhead associated (FHA) protein
VDVLLSDPTVSRSHAKLTLEAGKCRIEDLGSSNGTYAGGARIQPGEKVEITDGAELKFGSAILTLVIPPSPEVEEQPEEAEVPAEEPAAEEVAEPVEEPLEVPAEQPETEEVAEVEAPEPVAPVAMLVSTTDPEKSYPVMPGSNSVGRRGTNSIVLDDPYVSGSHAEIVAPALSGVEGPALSGVEWDEGGFWVTDLGSTNGTTLNGQAIAPNARMPLNPGDEIVFGRTALRFDVPEAEEPSEPTGE